MPPKTIPLFFLAGLLLAACVGVTPWRKDSVEAILAKHQPESLPDSLKPGDRTPQNYPKFLSPVAGTTRVLSAFGRRDGRPHEGLDLKANEGTALQVAAPGVVIYAGNGINGYGDTLIVKHDGGFFSIYAHLSEIFVKPGQNVVPGTTVARSGSTGRATGPHLHFEIRRGQKPFDPAPFIFPIVLP